MYHWTKDMIRFMEDASAYGSYHKKLAALILPYLQGCSHICDSGCGLGTLSVELSYHIEKVTAVDIKPQAVSVLRRQCDELDIKNIDIREGDIHELLPAELYDGMVFCFYGMSEEILDIARAQCRGSIVVIKKNYCSHRFSAGIHPTGPDGYTRMCSLLDSRGIPWQGLQTELEFGQPFRNFEDVRAFYRCYSRDEDPCVLTDEFLRSKVVETGEAEFPLYMPHKRQLGIIHFKTGDIQ